LGAIEREELGVVTPHEHIFIDLTGFFEEHPVSGCAKPAEEPVTMDKLGILDRDPYALRDNLILDDPALQREELMRFKRAGGRTVVDATMPGIGRDAGALRKMALDTGLNIVMGTGYYVGTTHPPELAGMDAQDVAALMEHEIRHGVGGTGVRAGVIGEIGVSEVFSDSERKVLRAAALAQRATGAGVLVHINPWTTNGGEAARILLDAGVAPGKICVCHVDVEDREDYILRLLGMGVLIEFDNFGKEYYVDREVRRPGYGLFVKDTERVALLARLVEAGYADRILLSCDVCLKTLLRAYGGWGYDHLLANVLPMMREAGIREEHIDGMLRRNPAGFLDMPS
jgi:phosphotriesterase-related protein